MKNVLIKIRNGVREHYWIIILSFLLTILIFTPLMVFPYVIKNEYRGININHFGADAHFYLSRAREVLDGHGLGSPWLREGKNDADTLSSYADYILLAPIKLLGLEQKVDLVAVYNIYNFIGVVFIILMIYFFVYQLAGKKLLAAAAALAVVGGYSIIFHKTLFYNDSNIYLRVIVPYFSSLIFFIYLNLLVKTLKSAELRYSIFSALVFGLLFYIYFFAWSFVLALNASLFLVLLVKKDFASMRKVLFISLAGLALGFYTLTGLLVLLGSSYGKQASYFIMMSFGHQPVFSKIGFITLILLCVYWYKKRDDPNLPFILAIILSGWAALNQQIITGRMIQYGHYYWYYVVPLSIIMSFYLIWQLIENEKLKKYLFIFIILVVFINTAGGQYRSFFATLEPKKYEQNFRPLIDYLNRDTRPAVILAVEGANENLFTIYTPHDLFWNSAILTNNISIQRIKDTLFVYSYLNKEIRNNFKDYFTVADNNKSQAAFYLSFYRSLEGYWSGLAVAEYNEKIKNNDPALSQNRPATIGELNKEYDEVLKNNGIAKLLNQYGANYIVWDKNINPEWDLSALPDFKPVLSSNNIYLYGLAN